MTAASPRGLRKSYLARSPAASKRYDGAMSDDAPELDDDFVLADLAVRDCQPAELAAFRELNFAWIRRYFTIEPKDRALLDDPQQAILDQGGIILVAVWHKPNSGPIVVGTCALLRDPDDAVLQLAKMAVDDRFQGNHIGYLIGEAALARARHEGMDAVRLETNSKLTPAIRLYEKLGFGHVAARQSAYTRADVQMRIDLKRGPNGRSKTSGTKP